MAIVPAPSITSRMSIHAALNHVTHYKLRPPGQPGAAGGAPAPGAALPQQRHFLLAARSSPRATSSTGSRTRSPTTRRAWCFRKRPPSSRSRWTWWSRWRSTTRSTSSWSRGREVPVHLRAHAARRAGALPGTAPSPTPLLQGLPGQHRPQAKRAPSTSWSALNQQLQRDIKYLIRMEPGVQTPEETLELASGSCRDSGWLLVQLLRHLRPGRALRVGLPDPAQARCEGAGRPQRHRRWTSPTCTPGARSTCPAPAGSAWTPRPA
jgi:hypothetical protein